VKGEKFHFMVEMVVSKTDNNAITILKQGQLKAELKAELKAYICDRDYVFYINPLQIEYSDFYWSLNLRISALLYADMSKEHFL
jgi:hypothetical protein